MTFNFTNDTVNTVPSCALLQLFLSENARTGKTIAYLLLGVFALIGNFLVLGVLYKNREMRTATNIFIANMAVSDLIYPLIVIPKEITMGYTNGLWVVEGVLGAFLCKVLHFLQDVSTTVSIESHVAISFERFYAVMFPLRARQSNNHVRIFVLVFTWVSGLAHSALHFYTYRTILHPQMKSSQICIHSWEPLFSNNKKSQLEFYLTSFTLLYAVPLIIVTVLYTMLFFKLRQKKVIGTDFVSRTARENQQNKHIVKLAITIVVIFAISWAPVQVVYMLFLFKWNWTIPCGMQILFFGAFYVAWLNSFTNPLIYFIFSQNYRNGLRNLLRGIVIFGSRFRLTHNSVGVEPTLTAISSEMRETSRETPRRMRRKLPSPELSMMRPSSRDSLEEVTSSGEAKQEVTSSLEPQQEVIAEVEINFCKSTSGGY